MRYIDYLVNSVGERVDYCDKFRLYSDILREWKEKIIGNNVEKSDFF